MLCEYLERNPELVRSKTILELGAGTGLVGMVASLLGMYCNIGGKGSAHLYHIIIRSVSNHGNCITLKYLCNTSLCLKIGSNTIFRNNLFMSRSRMYL